MGNFSIDIVWAKIQMAVAAIGGWLGYFLGGMDRLMIALIVFMALDYIRPDVRGDRQEDVQCRDLLL